MQLSCVVLLVILATISSIYSQTIWESPEAEELTKRCYRCGNGVIQFPDRACCDSWFCWRKTKYYSCVKKFDKYYTELFTCDLHRETCLNAKCANHTNTDYDDYEDKEDYEDYQDVQ